MTSNRLRKRREREEEHLPFEGENDFFPNIDYNSDYSTTQLTERANQDHTYGVIQRQNNH